MKHTLYHALYVSLSILIYACQIPCIFACHSFCLFFIFCLCDFSFYLFGVNPLLMYLNLFFFLLTFMININLFLHWLDMARILSLLLSLSSGISSFLFCSPPSFSIPLPSNLSLSFSSPPPPPPPSSPTFPPHSRKVARSESARVDRHSSRRRGSSRAKQSRSRSDVDLQPPSSTTSPAPLSPQHLHP